MMKIAPHRFRFSLRTLMVVVTSVCVCVHPYVEYYIATRCCRCDSQGPSCHVAEFIELNGNPRNTIITLSIRGFHRTDDSWSHLNYRRVFHKPNYDLLLLLVVWTRISHCLHGPRYDQLKCFDRCKRMLSAPSKRALPGCGVKLRPTL